MTQPPPADARPIESAVHAARRQINRGVACRAACWSALLGGAGALAVGLAYVSVGHRVPPVVYGVAAVAALVIFLAGWFRYRVGPHEAAGRLDERFGLADGLTSARTFDREQKRGGFYHLQQAWAESAASRIDPRALRSRLPRPLLTAALALPLLAGLLGFRPPSPAVLEARQQAAATLELGDSLNQGIREEVQRHLDEAELDERELLEPESLKETAERLRTSEDRADLMRQYAAMEQKLADLSQALQQQRAERFLSDAADRLSENASTSALAEALRQKRYDDAAELLRKMTPDPQADAAAQQRRLDPLKSASAQLAQAAKRFKAGAASSGSAGKSGGLADDLATVSEQLDQAARDYDENLEKSQQEAKQQGQPSDRTGERLRRSRQQTQQATDSLRKKLKKMNASRKARSRLTQMRQTLSQCQGACAGQNQNPFAMPGGKKAGSSTSNSTSASADPDYGRFDAITGQKNAGPSQTVVEDAASGTGTSGRRASAPAAQHSRQLESFVDRPDVPEPLREGVKTYFESLHEAPEETLAP
ncbi:MAG: hypothetical protein AAGG38_01325 [Planctomycetota bacterium]